MSDIFKNVPTATPVERDGEIYPICLHCKRDVKKVPGGSGSIWIHGDGFRACADAQKSTPVQPTT